jgi:hypothetical protein
MYAADAEEAAMAESLLHDIHVEGGVLPFDKYSTKALALLEVTGDLRLLSSTAWRYSASRSALKM